MSRRAAVVAAVESQLIATVPFPLTTIISETPTSYAMSTPASTRRRRSQVFVEIPTSPLLSTVSRSGVVVDTTPFKAVPVNVDTQHAESPSTSKQLKRKTPDDLQKSIKDASDVQQSRPKKQKLENASDAMPKKPKVKADKALTEGAEASTDPKPPPTNCHQCARTVIQPESE